MRGDHRQLHSVENSNRAVRRAATHHLVVCEEGADYDPVDIGSHATVVPVRNFDFVVPHTLNGEAERDSIRDPSNILGPVMAQNVPLVCSHDFDSLMAAFNKRSNFLAEVDSDDIADDVFYEALDLIDELPDLFEQWDDNPVDRERWMSKFDGGKRSRMEKALDTVDQLTPELGTKNISVKREVLLKRNDPTWAPRIIYAGSDAFNAVTGPPSMIVMERACQLFRWDDHSIKFAGMTVDFCYKLNDVKIAEFVMSDFAGETCLEGDFSRNDREQRRRVALLYDCWLKKLGLPEWFRTLLITLEKYKVICYDFGLKAWLAYQLATGTTSTTPRNSLYNLTMFGVSMKRQKITRGLAIILGDDILARVFGSVSLDVWVLTVALFKMVLKAFSPELDGHATLLSRRFICNGEIPCMVPKLGKALARFNVRASQNAAVSDSQYMAGKALSYAYEFRHCPVISSAFIARYEHEDHNFVDLSDLSWFARTSGIDTAELLLHCIKNESVIVDEDTFIEWCVNVYGLYQDELRDLLTVYISQMEFDIVDEPLYDLLEIDF